jgi:ATP synthase subunit 6
MLSQNPLEQFQIIPIIPFKLGPLDFSLTNSALILILSLVLVLFLTQLVSLEGRGNLVPNRYQYILESIYTATLGLISDQLGPKQGEQYFPYIFAIFTFLLVVNLLGMIPYSFTVMSHIIITFTLALGVFIGVNIIMFREHGIKSFGFFLPGGAPFGLLPLLIGIEIISFIIRPLTLSVRLFANMMSGHILLKVLLGFA